MQLLLSTILPRIRRVPIPWAVIMASIGMLCGFLSSQGTIPYRYSSPTRRSKLSLSPPRRSSRSRPRCRSLALSARLPPTDPALGAFYERSERGKERAQYAHMQLRTVVQSRPLSSIPASPPPCSPTSSSPPLVGMSGTNPIDSAKSGKSRPCTASL